MPNAKPAPPSTANLADRTAFAIATLGPAGRMGFAPGTWGSAAAVLAAPLAFTPLELTGRVAALAAVLAVGTWAAGRAERVLGRSDPGCVVVDELLGQWAALLPFHLPETFSGWSVVTALEFLSLFVLFRLFDILKPWPIRLVDRSVHGGLGIMLDDLLAGFFAAGAYALLRPLF